MLTSNNPTTSTQHNQFSKQKPIYKMFWHHQVWMLCWQRVHLEGPAPLLPMSDRKRTKSMETSSLIITNLKELCNSVCIFLPSVMSLFYSLSSLLTLFKSSKDFVPHALLFPFSLPPILLTFITLYHNASETLKDYQLLMHILIYSSTGSHLCVWLVTVNANCGLKL